MKVLQTASLGSNFTGSYKKKECSALCQNKFVLIPLIEYAAVLVWTTLYIINHTKEQQNTIHRIITKFCIETIYIFPDKRIMSLTIQPPAVCDKVFKK